MAMLVDPATTTDNPPLGWNADCAKVLRKFYEIGSADLINARSELRSLVAQDGEWGEEVQEVQDVLRQVDDAGKSHIQVTIEEQLKFQNLKPQAVWKTIFQRQFPLLLDIALRLLSMMTQTADVERNCKVQKVVKTKNRNRLKNKNVKMLCYCYANLRLLKRLQQELDSTDELEDFLESALILDDEEDTAMATEAA